MLNNLGELARCMNEYDQAQSYYLESLLMRQRSGSPPSALSFVTMNLGYVYLYQREDVIAVSHFKETLRLFDAGTSKTKSEQNIYSLAGLAAVLAYRGEAEAATCAYGTVVSEFKKLQIEYQINRPLFEDPDQVEFDRYMAICRAQLDEVSFNAAWERGRTMGLDEAIELALQIVG